MDRTVGRGDAVIISPSLEQVLLTASMAVPALALLYRPRFFPKLRIGWLFLICCLAVYALMLARVALLDARFAAELRAFDLDGDGGFSGAELTAEQALAMQRFANDTARGLAPITAVVGAPMVVAASFAIVLIVSRGRAWLMDRLRTTRAR